jgi:hypothetical protein
MEDMMRPFREWQKITEAVAQNRAAPWNAEQTSKNQSFVFENA